MKKIWISAALAALMAGIAGCGSSDNSGSKDTYKVALWGDQFYAADADLKAQMKTAMIDSINGDDVEFTLFAGDTKSGSVACTDYAIGQEVIDVFNRFNAPTIYTLGDNEWTDCHRTNNGSYDPIERLDYLRKTFFATTMSQGTKPIELQRQGTLGGAYSENSLFTQDGVTFASLHVIGSDNNHVGDLAACAAATNSLRTEADCAAAEAEYQARNAKNIQWLNAAFDEAEAQESLGIMILIQANPKFENLDPENGFADFINTLRTRSETFNGQVALVHGDSHTFQVTMPMKNAQGLLMDNFIRTEVFGSSTSNWVEATIDLKSKNIFSFKPVIINVTTAAN